jgi:hypothetical protein
MEWLLSTVEGARERFEAPGEYPLIDDGDILDQNVVYQSWAWEYGHWEKRYSRDSLIEAALTSDDVDLPVRFTWLNLFYHLATYPADEVASVIEDWDNAASHRHRLSRSEADPVGDFQRLRDQGMGVWPKYSSRPGIIAKQTAEALATADTSAS